MKKLLVGALAIIGGLTVASIVFPMLLIFINAFMYAI